MNTRNLMRKLPSCLLGAIFVMGVASTTVNAVDGNPPGLFELEGDIPDDFATPGDDWGSLYAGTNLGTPLVTTEDEDSASPTFGTLIVSDPAPHSIFTQGGSKDVNDVSAWKHTDGAVPDKDDITNAYAAGYTNPADVCLNLNPALAAVLCTDAAADTSKVVHHSGDLIVYFGLDRLANNGDANAGFWFFQNEVHADANGNFVDGAGNPATHVAKTATAPGDLFIIVKYPQGATAVPIIKIYEWDPNDVDGDKNFDPTEQAKPPKNVASPLDLLIDEENAECDGLGGKTACAITNLVDLPVLPADPDPVPWPYTPKSGSGLPHESFYEGGINVSKLLNTTPCFASFLAETRSSESQTAQLKDFVLARFAVCGIHVEKACFADLNETGTGVDVSFNGTLANTGGSDFIAYLKDDLADATIDRVCVDAGIAGCENGTPGDTSDDDANVADLVLQSDGSAYFPLAGGATVRYEGHYSVAGLPTADPQDTVTALAFGAAADVPGPGEVPDPTLVIVDDSDTASCAFAFETGLEVFKECSLAFINGNSVELTISGTVTNTGDVPLSNVTVTDDEFGSLELKVGGVVVTSLAKDEIGSFSATFPVAKAAVVTGETALGGGLTQVNLSHGDTVTAQGETSTGDVVPSNLGVANCDGSFTRGIAVAKECDQVILETDIVNGRLVVKVLVKGTVTNIGDEDLSGIVLSDDPPVVFDSYPTTLEGGLAVDDSFPFSGFYYPTSAVDLTNLTPLQFSDEASVSANGVFSLGASSADSGVVDCPLCPTTP